MPLDFPYSFTCPCGRDAVVFFGRPSEDAEPIGPRCEYHNGNGLEEPAPEVPRITEVREPAKLGRDPRKTMRRVR